MNKNVAFKNEARSNNPVVNETNEEYSNKVVPGCISVSLPGPFSNLSALFDVSIRSLEVIFDYSADNVNQEGTECKTHIQVLDKVGNLLSRQISPQ